MQNPKDNIPDWKLEIPDSSLKGGWRERKERKKITLSTKDVLEASQTHCQKSIHNHVSGLLISSSNSRPKRNRNKGKNRLKRFFESSSTWSLDVLSVLRILRGSRSNWRMGKEIKEEKNEKEEGRRGKKEKESKEKVAWILTEGNLKNWVRGWKKLFPINWSHKHCFVLPFSRLSWMWASMTRMAVFLTSTQNKMGVSRLILAIYGLISIWIEETLPLISIQDLGTFWFSCGTEGPFQREINPVRLAVILGNDEIWWDFQEYALNSNHDRFSCPVPYHLAL